MTTRYAYIVNGQTIWGPGANPYFITLTNGDIWEISAHSIEESETIGVYEVVQVNQKDFNPEFFSANAPEYSIVDGRPTETWSYSFIPTARDNMIKSVDTHAEVVRKDIATGFPGQYAEYEEVYKEALEVLALPESQVIEDGQYPFLDADINVTYSYELERVVQNHREAATLVVETRNLWKQLGSDIRKDRLRIKKEIREAATVEEAYEIYKLEMPGYT